MDKNNTEKKEEKIVTRYDRKMERRKAEKEKEKQSQKRARIIGFAVLAVVVIFLLSFPVRNYLAVNQTYIKVNGEKVTQVEYDYYFGLALRNYESQYGSYLSYYGIDLSGDLTKQMYSDTLTMKDYFDMNTVDMLKQNKAMLAQAKADGFTYDVSEDYDEFVETLKAAAADSGQTVREYVREIAGDYATLGRLSKYIKETLYITQYYTEKEKEFAPTDAEVESYYQENKDTYDSFDYHMTVITAELPTEPTNLADSEPVYDESGAYTPSDAEVAKAMEDAKALAETEQKNVEKTGEEYSGVRSASMVSYVEDWLLDESRKTGDTTVIENTAGNSYYVVSFERRYLDLEQTVNARILFAQAGQGSSLLDEWKSGEATEESFIALSNEKSLDTSAEGGLYEGLSRSSLEEEMEDWLFDEARKQGDTGVVSLDDYDYVVYYIGKGDPYYQITIRNILQMQGMNEFVTSCSENITVEDPKKNLNYLLIQEAESQALEDSGTGENTDGTNAGTDEESSTSDSTGAGQNE